MDEETETLEAKPPDQGDAVNGGCGGVQLALTQDPVPLSLAHATCPPLRNDGLDLPSFSFFRESVLEEPSRSLL